MKILTWVLGLVVGAGVLIAGSAYVAYSLGKGAVAAVVPNPTATVATKDARSVQSLVREEKVVLVSARVQGILEKKTATKLWGIEVPGSSRAAFIQYNFTAKLGIEGGDVKIKELGEKGYLVTIPDFIFIGHDDVTFRMAVEQNGVLSWITPEIDELEAATQILSEEGKQGYVDDNDPILRSQAQFFYSSIIQAIDPGATVEVIFRSDDK